jgi:hypothetical protein
MSQHASPHPLHRNARPQVHQALSPQLGGSAFASLEEIVARLARAGTCKGFPSAKEGLLVSARFLLAQFEKLDGASGHKALKYLETDFGKGLAKEVRALCVAELFTGVGCFTSGWWSQCWE